MTLARFTLKSTTTSKLLTRTLVIRYSSQSTTASNIPKPALHQLSVPSNEKGFFRYDRDWSRDSHYKGQKLGDTPGRMLFRRLGHAYEIYPILALIGVWFVIFSFTIYISFSKIEVWLDRSKPAPWEWEQVRDKYWKMPTLTFDKKGVSHKRCLLMEQLQDEMLEASKRRHNDEV